ncbi:MAG: zinc finger-like domain-containing protein [Candidatus Lokiarchaeota archaeon]|nr:zinc finger-like domain-containing protein [Candidatus Lokiarchaeota archaeon]
MPDVVIKTPNSDTIFEKWKQETNRKNRKRLEKEFGTKGAVFSTDIISAAETVKDTMKEAAIYFAIKRSIEPVKEGEKEETVKADRVSRIIFYTFKKDVIKDNWDGEDLVPFYNTIKTKPCQKCNGQGYHESKCKACDGKGKISTKITVLEDEEKNKVKKDFGYPCDNCYGIGKFKEKCKECNGNKNLYTYNIKAVPFKRVVSGQPVLNSSAKTKYEKEIEKDLHQLIDQVEGIRFNDFKEMSNKAEASLGYWNKNIKKTINNAGSDYKTYEKDMDTKIETKIFLFPMIQMFCETKKGKSFEIYSIGSDKKFIVYSNF